MFQGDCASIKKGFTYIRSVCMAKKKGCPRIYTLLADQKGTDLGIPLFATRTPSSNTLIVHPLGKIDFVHTGILFFTNG